MTTITIYTDDANEIDRIATEADCSYTHVVEALILALQENAFDIEDYI